MLKLIIILVLIFHGIGHIMGFMAAWTPAVTPFTRGAWLLGGEVVMDSAVGRVMGLLWLLPLLGFVAGAVGLWQQTAWHRPLLLAAAILSAVLILPWWPAMPRGSYLGALAVDLLTIGLVLTPWGQTLLGHA